jgi:GAF domain-containing protein
MFPQSIVSELFNLLLQPRFRYTNNLEQVRARLTLLFSALLAAAALIAFLSILAFGDRSAPLNNILTLLLAGLLAQLFAMSLVHSGQLRLGMLTLFTFLVLVAVIIALLSGVGSSSLLILSAPLLYGSLVWSWSSVIFLTALEIVLIGLLGNWQSSGAFVVVGAVGLAPEAVPTQTLVVQLMLGGIGVFCAAYAYELRRSLQAANRWLTQLRASAEIAQLAAASGTLAELMPRIANYIRDRFGFYHVQIFWADAEQRYANLVASTGTTGEQLLKRGYRVAFNSQGAIGRALQSGEPIVADVRGQQGGELLPDARSEIALPLIVEDRVLGVLDIQSVRPNAFPKEQIEGLSILAAQVGAVTFSGHQIEGYRSALSDTRRMLLETEVNLTEARRLNQRLTGQAWEDYLKARSAQTVGYTLKDNRLQRDASWTPALEQAALNRQPVLMAIATNRQIVAVPIELRGRGIGAIEIELEGAVRQAETLEVLQALAQRLALSIDNARLFEQAQELAQRELEVNAISKNLQAIKDIDGLARTTLQELSRALGAVHASIRIGSLEDDSTARLRDGAG